LELWSQVGPICYRMNTGWAKKVIPLVHISHCTRGITFLAHPVVVNGDRIQMQIDIYTSTTTLLISESQLQSSTKQHTRIMSCHNI